MTKVTVNQKLCIGCGACVSTCPETFVLKGGKAFVKKKKFDDVSCEKEAESGCPVGAIKVED